MKTQPKKPRHLSIAPKKESEKVLDNLKVKLKGNLRVPIMLTTALFAVLFFISILPGAWEGDSRFGSYFLVAMTVFALGFIQWKYRRKDG